MNIETKWLDDFLSLARTQSFSRSAEERHITQPAFSRRIKALEEAIGCELVDRAKVPVKLTDSGQLFKVTARSLVAQLKDCRSYLQTLKQTGPTVIDFAISHTLSLSFFPRFLQSLDDQLGNTRYRQLIANVDDSVQALKNGVCDFLLAFEDTSLNSARFQKLSLSTEQLIPVCKANEEGLPLFTLHHSSPDIKPYLGYPKEIYLGRCVERILSTSPKPVELQLACESPLADSLRVMAMQGMGIAWVPSFAVEEELKQSFLVQCGDENWCTPLKICLYRCRRVLSHDAENLWTILSDHYGLDEK